MVKVNVEPRIIEWAYFRSSKSESIKSKFSKLDEWISGESSPTLKQLEEYAKATATPLGYFFLKEPPNETLPIPHYRTLDEDSPEKYSPELIDTIHMMQRRQEFMKEYLDEQIGEKLSFVSSFKGNSAIDLAKNIRELLNIEENWASFFSTWHEALKFLINKCEDNFITVMVNGIVGNNTHRKLNVDEFRGFVLVDENAPLIFINGSDAKSAQIFTLIHELGHLILGSSAIVAASPINNADYSVERMCNEAAVEFLCPEEIFIGIWNRTSNEVNKFELLARTFKVSQIVVARRLLELGFINKEVFYEFYNEYKEMIQQKPKSNGGNFYTTSRMKLGDLFTRAIIYRTQTKAIQYTDAYRLTGLKGNVFQKYVEFFERKGE